MMIRPSTSPITMHFGSTDAPYSIASPHRGTDFAYIPDNRTYAPVSGTVLVRYNNGNDGNAIYIQDGDFFHGLLHHSQILVTDGQHVTAGQQVGVMGDTGFAEGVHLHHALKLSGTFVDAEKYYDKETNMADLDLHPYNKGDAQNVAEMINHTTEELASKVDWNDVWYQVLNPYIRGLQQQIDDLQKQLAAGITTADPDGKRWRDYKALNKELNS